MRQKFIKGAIIGLGVFLLACMLIFFIRDCTKIDTWRKSGDLRSLLNCRDSLVTFSWVDQADFLASPFPSSGDTILFINDSAATKTCIDYFLQTTNPPGKTFTLTFVHDGVLEKTTIQTSKVKPADFLGVLILHLLRYLIAFSFVLVGSWAYLKRSHSSAVRVLALFCFAMTAVMLANVRILDELFATFQIPFTDLLHRILNTLALFFGSFWLNLQLLFPRPNRFVTRYPSLAYGLCYLPTIAAIVLKVAAKDEKLSGLYIGILIIIMLLSGLFFLVRNYFTSRNSLEKRQVKLVLWGSGLGLSMLVFSAFFVSFLQNQNWANSMMIQLGLANVTFLALLFSPLSFAYSFGKYGLLEVEGKLRRGTRFLLVTAALLVAFLALVYGISEFLLRTLHIESRTPTLLFAIALAIGFSPAQRKLQQFIEKRFYPERHHLLSMIRDFLQQLLSLPDQAALWEKLQSRLKEALTVEQVIPVLGEAPGSLKIFGDNIPLPFDESSAFIEKLKHDGKPLLVDEILASARIDLSTEERAWLLKKRIALVLPMISRSRMVGFLGLGFKVDQEDYSAEDLQILRSFASQVALAYENILLLEENLEKRRMEEELQMARKVQKGFLPEKIPSTPGLEVAARNRFCLEVAGDYFDVIGMENGRTVLAVGDVSGKGAGAALLMANLQASLRTAAKIGGKLCEIVSGINDLIVQNTPPEDYITFFTGVFDANTGEFTYVNAGHNPPFLLDTNGNCTSLSEGGLILGALPGMHYSQETLILKPGCRLLMYTDGVSEAMNGNDEEFGEERLISFLKQHRSLPCEEFVEKLEREVLEFRGVESLEDDFTLLMVCVKT